jgi:hypothetical protein
MHYLLLRTQTSRAAVAAKGMNMKTQLTVSIFAVLLAAAAQAGTNAFYTVDKISPAYVNDDVSEQRQEQIAYISSRRGTSNDGISCGNNRFAGIKDIGETKCLNDKDYGGVRCETAFKIVCEVQEAACEKLRGTANVKFFGNGLTNSFVKYDLNLEFVGAESLNIKLNLGPNIAYQIDGEALALSAQRGIHKPNFDCVSESATCLANFEYIQSVLKMAGERRTKSSTGMGQVLACAVARLNKIQERLRN